MKQTAVEWLCSQIYTIQVEIEAGNPHLKNKIKQAKEMEKQQKGYSLDDLKKAYAMGRTNKTIKDFNETFKNK